MSALAVNVFAQLKGIVVLRAAPTSGVDARRSLWLFVTLLVGGLLLRAAALPRPGTVDVQTFKIWAYNAAVMGPAHVYGIGGSPPEWRTLIYNGNTARVDYPPLALDALALVGRAYGALFPTFPDGPWLTIAVKLPAVAAGVALAMLILAAVARIAGAAAGRRAALAYWLNPAVILHGSVLGYIGELFALPALGALIAATQGIGWMAGGLVAVACLTKPQGLLIVPAVTLALFRSHAGGWRAIAIAILAAGLVVSACVWPIVRAGAFVNMCFAVGHLVTDDTLSANGANVWWLVTYAAQTLNGVADTTWMAAVTRPVEIVSIRSFLVSAGVDSSLMTIGAVAGSSWTAVLGLVAWATWHARRAGDVARLAALAALTVHAYTVLSVQVHENHLFLALPLLAIVATTRPRYGRVLLGISAIAALNLNLFYGFGEGYAIPRGVTGIDASVLLALVNCVALVWHARAFRFACTTDADAPSAPIRFEVTAHAY
jgi:hypothetical protein